jgi:hypothetical protein
LSTARDHFRAVGRESDAAHGAGEAGQLLRPETAAIGLPQSHLAVLTSGREDLFVGRHCQVVDRRAVAGGERLLTVGRGEAAERSVSSRGEKGLTVGKEPQARDRLRNPFDHPRGHRLGAAGQLGRIGRQVPERDGARFHS